ncbi:hypothetical protein C8F01DRAFT_1205978 [Mycena amicta]|nr:hypothetical protein C8F01DRAFT_1205978 [Mycena amicta]
MSSLVSLLTSLVKLLCGQSPVHKPQEPPQPSKPQSNKPPQHGHFSDPNQANQHDPHYMALRADANKEGDEMARCFSESREAYTRGDGALAKQLSQLGKQHQATMNRLNSQAADWIFDSGPGEVDLHGLYVREAIDRTDRALEEAKRKGDKELRLIVGKGLHSKDHAAKLKPAIEDLHRLVAELDPHNGGVLVVHMGGSGGVGGVGPDDIARRVERGDCIVM